ALDARIRVADPAAEPRAPLAITPYPSEWERTFEIAGLGPVDVRPVRPEDEALYVPFFAKVDPADIRLRFMTARKQFPHEFLARLTQIDYAREMAFVAIDRAGGELLGVVRLILDPDLETGEYGILVRSDLHGRGLGGRLMQLLVDYAHARAMKRVTGLVLAENTTMLAMASELGFAIRLVEDDAAVREVVLDLARI
ncbi:MAG: GNAT family N-acetyltransferase, partial [Kofleriaceae bacterium]|nr:GNAT family N-acetyltransferase [Kofleriaceae bacterium]